MRGNWVSTPGALVVTGAFGDIEVHHHPAVQLAVGVGGPLVVVDGEGTPQRCAIAVVAGGVRHSLQSAGATSALSVYLGPETSQATALTELCRRRAALPGLWALDGADDLAAAVVAAVDAGELARASELLVTGLLADAEPEKAGHPQVRQAIELLAARIPDTTDLGTVAGQVAVSPDYLGRLFRRQTGTSFSATARWLRLLAALEHLAAGTSITDAAHRVGFADGAHATRACRELTGITPRDVVRALN